ncbi:uncharacterized protein PRCAT00003361001 [Priceomyces carsonii]|uniref:uncharacterized protein n=1 Tax=Priceomyces carsonii TaxID=28549 RepID=UPI002ED807DF|nr:unnamed protein product [Priceomyces carsonii]
MVRKSVEAELVKQSEKEADLLQIQLSSSSGDELSSEEESDIEGLSSEEESQNEDDSEGELNSEIENKTVAERPSLLSGHSVNKTVKRISPQKESTRHKRAIIYIGRIPHGFYEDEMKKYFTQFGNIINLKLSRNKKTGKSKHYGFVEFDDYEVAKIASETMNNYLIFGHLLKCKLVDGSHVHESMFNLSGKFKVLPWKKISKHRHDKPKSKEQWEGLVKKHEQRKASKLRELKKKGIDFDLAAI